jgi:hypothetical protein
MIPVTQPRAGVKLRTFDKEAAHGVEGRETERSSVGVKSFEYRTVQVTGAKA